MIISKQFCLVADTDGVQVSSKELSPERLFGQSTGPLDRSIPPEHQLMREGRASLVVKWLRISLPLQATHVQFLVQADPTGLRATKPACLEPVLHNQRSHCNKKPAHCNEE